MANILEVHDVVKQYASHRALDGVSLDVPQGTIFGLLGPNGAGKTSLIRIITQITAPDEGYVLLDGERLRPQHIKHIGYLPEERGLYKKMKVGEQLLYLAQLKGLSEREAMDKLKIWFQKFDIKTWWTKSIEDLSKGMQQKIQFVATVMHEPKLIILDEPFSGFDPINANLIKDEILELRDKGTTIIFSTHRMESVEELCDHMALIHKSNVILKGSKKQVKDQFKENSYSVTYHGVLESLPADFELISQKTDEDSLTKATIRLVGDASVNALVGNLISQVELVSFHENIPSFNDIFIKAVGGTMPEEISNVQ
ncbi:ABC transporter ATP-binding protein [Runella slithyformis]|uniref:ABC transporter related protein n=1 Tax=Runella slithyformis (strain ATCC 29530 / DSM 19594 / LMG 11500 / NCIMB 11436 / LSU 4) TaxID=761193 RepID=A0A7U4E5Q8_RUNSL|nr:ATP-binding cassette domain-containing protein [Runella slithyformis]AEI48821.1 ABC transporter related protein [Runella slithyformis DSM 19594]